MTQAAFRDSELLKGRAFGQVYLRENPTEPYVCVPSAAVITDQTGATWTLGTEYLGDGRTLEFNVLRNDTDTGEFASKIEYLRGQVRIFGRAGRRIWNGRAFI